MWTTFGWVIRHVDGKSASGGTWILAILTSVTRVVSGTGYRLGELVGKCDKVVFWRWSRNPGVSIESDIKCLWRCLKVSLEGTGFSTNPGIEFLDGGGLRQVFDQL